MPRFSNRSQAILEELHPDLQTVLMEAIKYTDFTILEGHRGKAEQNAAYSRGASKLQWPHSKHNEKPARAVDLAPWPTKWSKTEEFAYLAGVILATAKRLGINVRWGGHWNTFVDRPHFEL